MPYFIAPYIGSGTDDDPFRPRASDGREWSAIDLRSDPTQVGGFCLLWARTDPGDPLLLKIADGKRDSLSATKRAEIETLLGIDAQGDLPLNEYVRKLLIEAPAGKWRPLVSDGRKGRFEIILGPPEDPFLDITVGPKRSASKSFFETFNKADGALGPDLTWTNITGAGFQVVSNAAELSNDTGSADRADSDADTSDTFTQADLTKYTVGGAIQASLLLRKDSSATLTYYRVRITGDPAEMLLDKVVSGTSTALTSTVSISESVPGRVERITANGSTIKGFYAGSEKRSVTDTSITSGTRGGLDGRAETSTVAFNNFQTGDLGFPTVQETATSTEATATTSHTVTLPANITSGDLLIVFIAGDPDGTDGAGNFTFPTGWTELYDVQESNDTVLAAAFRVADGTEGATITVTSSESTESGHVSYRITGHDSGTSPESATAKGDSTSPDSPSLAPSWGSEDTLWLASMASDDESSQPATADPTDYVNPIEAAIADGGGSILVRSLQRSLTASSDDPSAFTISDAQQWVASTVAVRPATAVIDKQLDIVATGVSGLTRLISAGKAIISIGVADALKTVGVTLPITAAGVTGLTRLISVTKGIVAAGTVGLARLISVGKAIISIATVGTTKDIGVTLATVSSGITQLTRGIGKNIAIVAGGVAGFVTDSLISPTFYIMLRRRRRR